MERGVQFLYDFKLSVNWDDPYSDWPGPTCMCLCSYTPTFESVNVLKKDSAFLKATRKQATLVCLRSLCAGCPLFRGETRLVGGLVVCLRREFIRGRFLVRILKGKMWVMLKKVFRCACKSCWIESLFGLPSCPHCPFQGVGQKSFVQKRSWNREKSISNNSKNACCLGIIHSFCMRFCAQFCT